MSDITYGDKNEISKMKLDHVNGLWNIPSSSLLQLDFKSQNSKLSTNKAFALSWDITLTSIIKNKNNTNGTKVKELDFKTLQLLVSKEGTFNISMAMSLSTT